MASLVKKYDHEKLNGQIYTPINIVQKILDDMEYNNPQICGKSILDPACGDGRFICEIARRIIKFSKTEELAVNLSKIHAWDIDEAACNELLLQLNQLIKDFNIQVNWNISPQNSLLQIKQDLLNEPEQFDYIVGNPPYIRIQHLEYQTRQYIQANYNFCQQGSTDIYIAFFELALVLCKPNGICGFITPNSYLTSQTAWQLRNYFAQNQNIKQISNYGAFQVFDNATIYSAITIFTPKKQPEFQYQKYANFKIFTQRIINYNEIIQQKIWRLNADKPNFDSDIGINKKLSEICSIHVGITTLCDKAYIFTLNKLEANITIVNSHFLGQIPLESALLKPIIKGSKIKNSHELISQFVLFPYQQIDGQYKIIPQEIMQKLYPNAFAYLQKIKDRLNARDNGKINKTAWYAFGRSQSLNTGFGKKIIFSPMNAKPNFIYSNNDDATIYSGYFIKYNGDYHWLLRQLNSERMQEYIAVSARDFQGGWKAYSKKIIEDFPIIL